MANMKLSAKIYAGFGFILLLLLGTSVSGWFSLKHIGIQIDSLVTIARQNGAVGDIQESVLLIRQKARDFVVGAPSAVKDESEVYRTGIQRIRRAMTLFDKQDAELLKGVGDIFSAYHADFESFAKLEGERQQIMQDELHATAAKAEQMLQLVEQQALRGNDPDSAYRVSVARGRLFAAQAAVGTVVGARYVAVDDSAAVNAARAAIEAADTSAVNLAATLKDPTARSTAAAVPGVVASYSKGFDHALAAIRQRDAKIREALYGSLGPKMQDVIISFNNRLDSNERGLNNKLNQLIGRTKLTSAVIVGVALLVGVLVSLLLGKIIVRGTTLLSGVMARLAKGELALEVPLVKNRDEFGDMARALEVLRRNAMDAEHLRAEQEAARAARARRQDAMDRHTQDFGNTITGVMASLASSAAGMRRASDAMSAAANAVHEQAVDTASGANKSSQDLTAVAAAVEELTTSVGEISRQVTTAADVARQAVSRAESSQATMQGLSEAASRIGEVVHLISNIASQTNLLALNATIEAARAGEAGKGFAVVAGEVKGLAAQTAKATAEIGSQIERMCGVTGDAVTAMTEIGGIISRLNEVAAAISAAVEEQSVTTRQIASSIQAVSSATVGTAQAMTRVVEVALDAGTASHDVETGSADIGREAETLRAKVDEFLEAVRNDSGERRRFERILGNGVSATLRVAGREAVRAVVRDVSLGGVALLSQPLPIGTHVEIDLPDAGGAVEGRVTRAERGVVAISFPEDSRTQALVGRALHALGATREAA